MSDSCPAHLHKRYLPPAQEQLVNSVDSTQLEVFCHLDVCDAHTFTFHAYPTAQPTLAYNFSF